MRTVRTILCSAAILALLGTAQAEQVSLGGKPVFGQTGRLIILTKTGGEPIAIATSSIISIKQNGPGATVTVTGGTDHWVKESFGQILYIIDPRLVAVR